MLLPSSHPWCLSDAEPQPPMSEHAAKVCKACRARFVDPVEYRKHIRGCSKTVTVEWSNGQFTVKSGTDGRIECRCTNPRCMRVYQSVDGFKGHVSPQHQWLAPEEDGPLLEVSVTLAQPL